MKALQDEFLANGGEYKTYFLKDLFTIERGKRITKANRIQGNRPLVTAGYEHYGIADYISNPEQEVFLGNTITIDMFANVFYRSEEYSADDNILVLTSRFKMNKQIGLFICSIIRKHLSSFFSYGKQYRQKDFNVTKIDLPTLSNGELAFDFMASLIRDLEEERISDLEAYLEVTGLSDYSLSSAEQQAVQQLAERKWTNFNLKNLFGNATRGKRLKSADRINGDLPFVTAGEANTGISAYIGNEVDVFQSNTITIDMFGSTKYRDYEYGADDHVAVVHTESLSKYSALFLTTAIHKIANAGQFSYSRNFYAKDADELDISLPITEDGSIDYVYMDSLIGAIQKQVIEKVVAYKDEVISETKRIVHES